MAEHHAHQHGTVDVFDDCCQPGESDLVALIRSHLPATLAMQTGSWAEGQAAVLISNPEVVLRALGGVSEEEVRTWDAEAQHEFFRAYNQRAAWWFPWEAK